jgi:hypothetical protein
MEEVSHINISNFPKIKISEISSNSVLSETCQDGSKIFHETAKIPKVQKSVLKKEK